jgi:RNA polymerase sigma factor (sigma-70 family)
MELLEYSQDLSRVEILSHEKTLELYSLSREVVACRKTTKRPSKEAVIAHQRLVESCLRYVRKEARGFIGNGFDLDDLVEEGNLQCIRAVDGWDPSKGKLSTIVGNYVRNGLIKLIGEDVDYGIYVPKSTRNAVKEMQSIGVGSVDELAVKMKRSKKRIYEILQAAIALRVKPLSNVKRDTELDPKAPSNEIDYDLEHDVVTLKNVVQRLDKRTRDIIRRRFGICQYDEPQEIDEIGLAHNLCYESIRQIVLAGLKTIRRTFCADCKGCKVKFRKTQKSYVFCEKCRTEGRPCLVCKKPFLTPTSEYRRVTCSKACRDVLIAEKNTQRRTLKPMPCGFCKITFQPERSGLVYCCTQCYRNAKKKKHVVPCEFCKNDFMQREIGQKFCRRRCYAKSLKLKPQISLAPIITEITTCESSELLCV